MLTTGRADAVKVELAQEGHLVQIPAVELSAAEIFPDGELPDHVRYGVTHPQTLRAAQHDSRLWVAIDRSDGVVGFAMADVIDGLAHLDEMSVSPEFGRRGIGTRLVNAVCEWARRHGFDGLTLVTFRHLPWNAPFYEKLGFVALQQAELNTGLTSLINDEAEVGIDTRKRIGMILWLQE